MYAIRSYYDPRKGVDAERARRVTLVYVIGWLVTLAVLMSVIWLRRSLGGA